MAKLPLHVAFDNNKVVGFVAIEVHSDFTYEVCVAGVLIKYHKMGFGKALIAYCIDYCKRNKMGFLTVKTLFSGGSFFA